jgi:hypothetical protein
MSSRSEHIYITVKQNCIRCNVFFKKLCDNINCCLPITKKDDNDDQIELSNTDFNKKRTSSMNEYVVNSYISKKSDEIDSEVPKSEEKMDRV